MKHDGWQPEQSEGGNRSAQVVANYWFPRRWKTIPSVEEDDKEDTSLSTLDLIATTNIGTNSLWTAQYRTDHLSACGHQQEMAGF